jgi:glutathione S-transferase
MKLYYSTTSPYVRKAVTLAIETGLDQRIERIVSNVADPNDPISKANPLGKVPALVMDDGKMLYDSPVICEFLDSLHDKTKVFPASGEARWAALRYQALSDGILDAAVLRMLENKRPESERSAAWIDKQKTKVARTLDVLEDEAALLGGLDPQGALTIGNLSVGIALGYLDFRFESDNWRKDRPALADWYDSFSVRPSMMQTMPKEPA